MLSDNDKLCFLCNFKTIQLETQYTYEDPMYYKIDQVTGSAKSKDSQPYHAVNGCCSIPPKYEEKVHGCSSTLPVVSIQIQAQ